jgi:fructose-bisphosphate aldolase class 1
MDKQELEIIAQDIFKLGKGILAADGRSPTIKKRYATIGAESTEANRCSYRELLFTIHRCLEVTAHTLHAVYSALFKCRVRLEGTLLKPNMVVSGKDCPIRGP